MRVYIAGPFFNSYQVDQIEKIEDELTSNGISFFSPMRHGVLLKMTEGDKSKSKKAMFELNVMELIACDKVIAVIDDFDTGTVWEMGFAFGVNTPVISLSNKGYGLNVMLAESVQAHVKTLSGAVKAILDSNFKGEVLKDVH